MNNITIIMNNITTVINEFASNYTFLYIMSLIIAGVIASKIDSYDPLVSVPFFKNGYNCPAYMDIWKGSKSRKAKRGEEFYNKYKGNFDKANHDNATYDGKEFIVFLLLAYILYKPINWLLYTTNNTFYIINPAFTWFLMLFLLAIIRVCSSKYHFLYEKHLNTDTSKFKYALYRFFGDALSLNRDEGLVGDCFLSIIFNGIIIVPLTLAYKFLPNAGIKVLFIIIPLLKIFFIYNYKGEYKKHFGEEAQRELKYKLEHTEYPETIEEFYRFSEKQAYRKEQSKIITSKYGFNECSTKSEAKRLYKKLMKQNHPDNGGDETIAAEITSEYNATISILDN